VGLSRGRETRETLPTLPSDAARTGSLPSRAGTKLKPLSLDRTAPGRHTALGYLGPRFEFSLTHHLCRGGRRDTGKGGGGRRVCRTSSSRQLDQESERTAYAAARAYQRAGARLGPKCGCARHAPPAVTTQRTSLATPCSGGRLDLRLWGWGGSLTCSARKGGVPSQLSGLWRLGWVLFALLGALAGTCWPGAGKG
jgi:hypothetical protein